MAYTLPTADSSGASKNLFQRLKSPLLLWQEGARKDVERAFGVIQCKFKAIANPIHKIDPKHIGSMVACCIILHNMGVCDRVMGDTERRYDPGSADEDEVEEEEIEEEQAVADLVVGLGLDNNNNNNNQELPPSPVRPLPPQPIVTTNIRDFDIELAQMITQRSEIRTLENKAECLRLQRALIAYMHSWKEK